MKIVPLREQNELPIGVPLAGGNRDRSYAFKPWKGKDERLLAARRQEEQLVGAKFITAVLAQMASKWGGKDFETGGKAGKPMTIPERELAISMSYAADVIHAWFQLRRMALGSEMRIPIECDNTKCRKAFNFDMDLGTTDCMVVEADDILEKPLLLRDGFPFHSEMRKVLTLGPTRWRVYEGFPQTAAALGVIRVSLVAGSIVGVGGVDGAVMLIPEQLDDMTKYDFETIRGALETTDYGPSVLINIKCPECEGRIVRQIDWNYDSFFSIPGSSRGGPGNTA